MVFGCRATTKSRGMSANHASGHRSKSGNETINNAAENSAAPQFVSDGASDLTWVNNLERPEVLVGFSRASVATACCIAGEFTKR